MDFVKATENGLVLGGKPLLLRGFGLGGWLLPEGYMWKLYDKCDRPRRMEKMIEELCGKEYSEYFWNQYYKRYITEKDIALIHEEGFNSVRLPLNARHLYYIKNQKIEFEPDTIKLVDRLIGWCRKYKIYVILDMHGAPGGQTGQNIDDSEKDEPLLFVEEPYKEELVTLWGMLAGRYADDETVAGYDLLNEPLPNWSARYYGQVLPLYRRIIAEIRKVDRNHMVILEGVHWSTDFSIFEDLTPEEAADNVMLQFHKYWSNPDKESLEPFTAMAEKLKIPLFMGEGGENNYDWYTTAFPMYERLNISWSFWSYKKMDCNNSPVTFKVPEGWPELIEWLDGNKKLKEEEADRILSRFLSAISDVSINRGVFHALKRQPPVTIPCEAYDDSKVLSERIPGAAFRISDPVTILFESGKTGEADYKCYRDAKRSKEENLIIRLTAPDRVCYEFYNTGTQVILTVAAKGRGTLAIELEGEVIQCRIEGKGEYGGKFRCDVTGKQVITLGCVTGTIDLDNLELI